MAAPLENNDLPGMSSRLRLALVLACAASTAGCDWSFIDGLLGGGGGGGNSEITLVATADAIQVGSKLVHDDALQAIIDLTVRYGLVQDRAAPQYTLAESLAVGGHSACDGQLPGVVPADLQHLDSKEIVAVDYENPLLLTGMFLASLSLRDHARPNETERALMRATLHRLRSLGRRTSEPGYFIRFDRQHAWKENEIGHPDADQSCSYPHGDYCSVIDQGPYKDGGDKYGRNNIPRHWEPSADEIVGLMLGLSFSYHYSGDPEVKALARSTASDLASYLRHHSYFLERPCPDGGIAWRGGHLASYTYPFERIFASMGLGFDEVTFPGLLAFCARNQLQMTPFSFLLPCSPVMRDHDDTELAAMADAVQLPQLASSQTRFDLWTAGAQFPFLHITSSGTNLAALVFLALRPVDDDGNFGRMYETWYRDLQRNNAAQILPVWTAAMAFYGKPLYQQDAAVLDRIADPAIFSGTSLPSYAPGWHSDVTMDFTLPGYLLAAAEGHVVARDVDPRALPY